MEFTFLFPGQGSQSVGMMNGFDGLPVIKDTFKEASDVIGVDLWKMANEDNSELDQTINTQPLMLTAGVATWRCWLQESGAMPHFFAGHSLGEYTALVAAGAISFGDALPLVKYRAELMQNAVPEGIGAMAVILGLEDDVIKSLCLDMAQGQVVEAVNFNSPGQVVVAGDKSAVERVMLSSKDHGAKRAMALPVSVPSHCSLMRAAAAELETYLQTLVVLKPQVPVLHNSDVMPHDEPEDIKKALVRQLYSPVRWVETINCLVNQGVRFGAECGPGKVLTGLTKRISSELPCIALVDTDSIYNFKAQISQ